MNAHEQSLADARQNIDRIDRQILQLLEERAGWMPKIKKAKEGLGRPIFDAERQKSHLMHILEHAEESGIPRSLAAAVFETIMAECRKLQESSPANSS